MDQGAEMLAGLLARSMSLGAEWTVVDSEFRQVEGAKDELHAYIVRTKGHSVSCPECGRRSGVYGTRLREWRHLDTWQFKTVVHCDVPRAVRPVCGVHAAHVPREGNSVHFTALFEAQVLAMAMAGMTVAGMASVMKERDTRLWRLICAAVRRARETADCSMAVNLGVDETPRKKGRNYPACLADAPARRVIFVTEGKDAAAVGAFTEDLKAHGGCPACVQTVTCDMPPAFANSIKEQMPPAVRAIDRFHVMQPFARAIDRVRVAEVAESVERRELLKRTKHIWLKNERNLTARQAVRKRDLAKENLKTARAYAMKEAMQRVCECRTRADAETELSAVTSWIMHSNLPQMKGVGRMLKADCKEILDYFDHRFTNAVLEGMNSIVQSAKRTARGFRNTECFKAVIYHNLGKLRFPVLEGRSAA